MNCIVDNGQRDSEGGGAFIKGQCLCQLCVVVSIYIMGTGQIKYLKHEAYVSGSTQVLHLYNGYRTNKTLKK